MANFEDIRDLNSTIPDALDLQENQRVLVENFELLKNLVVSPGYISCRRHVDASVSLSTSYTIITNYTDLDTKFKLITFDVVTGITTLDMSGVYMIDIFTYFTGPASVSYTVGILQDSVTELKNYTFDAHGAAGNIYNQNKIIYEFSTENTNISFGVKVASGTPSVALINFNVAITRIDNYIQV